jgi:hypothetical protein
MTNIQNQIEELEKRASENDLLALLATDPDVRIYMALMARNFRLEALRLTTRRTSEQPIE